MIAQALLKVVPTTQVAVRVCRRWRFSLVFVTCYLTAIRGQVSRLQVSNNK